MSRTRRMITATIAAAALAGLTGLAGADTTTTSGPATSGTSSSSTTPPSASRPAEGRTGPSAQTGGGDSVGKELHSRAKAFGEALLDGAKYVGRTISNAFK